MVAKSGTELTLNGRGERQPFFLAPVIYEVALYLPTPSRDADAILTSPRPKTLTIRAMVDVDAKSFREKTMSRFQTVFGTEATQVAAFQKMLDTVPDLKTGDVLTWSYENRVFQLLHNSKVVLDAGSSAVFHALLQLYIGEPPIDAALRDKLLGRR